VHCSDGEITCSVINLIKQLFAKRLPSSTYQNKHRVFNFRTLSGCVSSLRMRSFLSKAVVLKFILWHWIRITTSRMRLCSKPLHHDHMCKFLLKNKKWYTCTVHKLHILVSFDNCYFSEVLCTVHFPG